MRVPDDVLNCVAFLGGGDEGPGGLLRMIPRGTGFFLSMDTSPPSDREHVYFVTARHVAIRLNEAPQRMIRVNTTSGGSYRVPIPGHIDWVFHDDTSVDIALVKWTPDPKLVQHTTVPTRLLLNQSIIDMESIGPGDDVFIVRLFSKLAGTTRNLPIVRTGTVAMMPGETVPTGLGLQDCYLIEARSLGGISGSPAFVRKGNNFYLMGLMHGHWDIPAGATNDTEVEEVERVNMGIAIVTPASKIMDIIMSEKLVRQRREMDDSRAIQRGS